MRVRVLGRLEVCAATGEPLDLGTPKQRTACALLLFRAGQLVTVEELIDELWPDNPPASALANTRTYVSNLRRVLAGAAVPFLRLDAPGPGYRLHVEPDEFDLPAFQDRLRRGRDALDRRAYAEAAEHLQGAIALWRGQALENVPLGPALNARCAGLRDERAAATEDLVEALLGLDRAQSAVPLLREHVGAYPLRERGWELLMAGLHRAGDVAGALSAYTEARAALVERLGVEPGARLRDLQRALLHGKPPPAGPAGSAAAPAPAAPPAQLPLDVRGFTARGTELARLDAILAEAGAETTAVVISAVWGTAGVGKTALAVHWAHRVADRFPDGQLYVNLRGFDPGGAAMTSAEAVRGFLDALRVPPQRIPAGLDAQVGLYRSLLAGKRFLVVLDNARDAGQVRPLLPGAPGCLVLVTSRNELPGLVAAEGAHAVALDLLTAAEARELLARRLGPGRVAAEPVAVDEIVERCARLPLALAVVAARAATRPQMALAVLAAELAATRLDAFAGEDQATDARAVFSWSYRALSPGAARLFRLLGLHPGPDIAVPAAASLAGVPAAEVRPLLTELTRARLLDEPARGRFAPHDLLRAYAQEQAGALDTEAERAAAYRRMFDHYLHAALAAARRLDPHRHPIEVAAPDPAVTVEPPAEPAAATAWFHAELPVLLAAVQAAVAGGFDTYAWQLAWSLATFLQRQGLLQQLTAVQHVAVEAAERLGDRAAQAHASRALGGAYARLEKFTEAEVHFRRALDLYGEIGDPAGQANAHLNVSWAAEHSDRNDRALRHAEAALDLFRIAGDRTGQARALSAVGWINAHLGHYPRAIRSCEEALVALREVGDPYGEASTWDSLGYAHHHNGDHRQAIDCFRRALELCRELGDRYHEAGSLAQIGDAHRALGETQAARDSWRRALAILAELEHPDAVDLRAKLTDLDTGLSRSGRRG